MCVYFNTMWGQLKCHYQEKIAVGFSANCFSIFVEHTAFVLCLGNKMCFRIAQSFLSRCPFMMFAV